MVQSVGFTHGKRKPVMLPILMASESPKNGLKLNMGVAPGSLTQNFRLDEATV